MLREISCELFKENKRQRPPVIFHKGLNVVLGSIPGKAASIGKSTMLLIIDFVFGGNTYLKSEPVRELGNHTIYFVFSFAGKDYRFARNTADAKRVFKVDENNDPIDSMEIKEFTDWLAKKYDMDLPGLSFRNTVSRFFRIYGKNNLNEFRPLQMRGGNESQKDAIHVLVALYNMYSSILAFEEQLHLVEDKIDAFKAARKYEFIPSAVDGMGKYQENIVAIRELEEERDELCNSGSRPINEAEVEEANRANEIERAYTDIRRVVKGKQDDLHLLELNLQRGIYPTEADLKSLAEFFPEANFNKLMDIESFHSKIQGILQEELESAKQKITVELASLQEQEESIRNAMSEIRPSMTFTQEFLTAYSVLEQRINKLQDENNAFDQRNKLQEEKKQANNRYQEQMKFVLKEIEATINRKMEEINDYITDDQYNAPHLTISKFDSYDFETPKDSGTSTNYRGMMIYDLAVLDTTVLPAIAHDSILFDPMPRPDMSRMIEIYNKEKEKQIFIAIDKTLNCSEEAQSIIAKQTVIKLENNEQALFGDKWSRKANR